MSKTAEACSASTIVAGAASGCHLLKIDGYSRTLDVPNGTYIRSRSFSVGGRTWSIDYYPNGSHSGCGDHISVFLHLQDYVTEAVKARFKFSLVDKTGQPSYYQGQSSKVHHFLGQNLSWGYSSFIKREALEASGHVEDDAFTVRCNVTVIDKVRTEDAKVPAPAVAVAVPPSDLARHLAGLFLAGDTADVTFSVGEETVAAHRCVLAARSPVFKAELLGAMKESTTVDAIRIKEMEADAFRAMLHFIYTDSLQETTTTTTVTAEEEDVVAAAFFQRLLVAADRYDIPRLKLTCERKLCERIGVETAAAMLVLAEQHHCHGLKKACLEFFSSPANLKDFMATHGVNKFIAKLAD